MSTQIEEEDVPAKFMSTQIEDRQENRLNSKDAQSDGTVAPFQESVRR